MSQNNIISIPKVQMLDDANAQNPTVISDETITNNGFFPDIDLIDVRNSMRIDGTVTNDRLKHAVIEAVLTVNQDLKQFKANCLEQEKRTLVAVGDDRIDGEAVLVYQYKRAVYCLAVANLYERYRAFDNTKEGHDKADELQNTAGDLKRDYHHAVRDILGENRLISELI